MNNDLELIYLQTVEAESKRLNDQFHQLVNKARDKQYATGYFGGIYLLQYTFNNGGLLSKRIKNHYESYYKLGMAVPEIIAGIPEVIKNYNIEAEHYQKKHKRKIEGVKIKWKKNNWGLPIGFDGIEVKIKNQHDPYFVLGPFGTAATTPDIAYELGKMIALDHFIQFLKNEYEKLGGVPEKFGKQEFDLSEKWQRMKAFLSCGDLENFFAQLKTVFASLPYQLSKSESDYHNIIHTMLDMLGFDIVSELPTNTGRIDTVVETDTTIYIMEFKVDLASALMQIEKRKYHERFIGNRKKIVLVGITISSEEKNISMWNYKVIN